MAAALPTVTLGVASYNNAHYLRATLESIRQQTYPHIEVVIVDDASRDDSVAVVENWMREFPEVNARLIRHETNLGICRGCNDIVGAAQGKYVCIIGSDDLFLPTKLAQQVPLLEAAAPNVAVLYSNIERIDSDGKLLTTEQSSPMPGSGNLFRTLIEVNSIAAMSTLVRRSALLEVGPYDESLDFEDWDMWLRLSRRFEFLYDPRPSAQYRIHTGSATYRRRAQMAESCIRLLQKHLGVSPETDRLIADHISQFAETLYFLGKPSTHWLRQRWRHRRDVRSLIMLNAAHLGIPAAWLSKAMSLMRPKPNQ